MGLGTPPPSSPTPFPGPQLPPRCPENGQAKAQGPVLHPVPLDAMVCFPTPLQLLQITHSHVHSFNKYVLNNYYVVSFFQALGIQW